MADDVFTIPEQAPAPEGVTIVADTAADPGAPYGRFANGKPRKSPQKQKRGSATAAAPKASTPRAPKKTPTDYRPVAEKAAAVASMMMAGLGRKNRAFLADAATIQIHSRQMAHVVNEMAQINPVIERLLQVSAPAVPYVEAASFLFSFGAQLAANHGVRLPVPGIEVHDPEQLARGMEQQLRQAQAAAEAAETEDAAADAWADRVMSGAAA